ncbi:MAG TPA: hypothetical protein VF820_04980, partial [Patescibacteria group bacterium]
ATAEELQMKEPQFVAMQEKILKQMHLPESFSQTAVVFHNLTISDIPAVYAQGYVNIGDYILAHYGDVMLAQAYYMRAIDTYPYLASAYTGMGYISLSQNNCKMAQNQFINAQQIDPTKRAPYMALYLSYLNCSKEPQKAEEVASNFSKNFGGSILDAIKVTQGFH